MTTTTKTLKGTGIVPQTTIGTLYVYKKAQTSVVRYPIVDSAAEVARFEAAKQTAIAELKELYNKAMEEVGVNEAMIFEVHQMMIEDEDYNEDIRATIAKKSANAEFAVDQAKKTFANIFEAMDDQYMRGRGADVRDISDRIINVLRGSVTSLNFEKPVILVAEELTPSETLQMDKEKVLAFVTTGGSKSSHTAILARMLGIPAIVQIDEQIEHYHGSTAAVDGEAGIVYLNPNAQDVEELEKKAKEQKERAKRLQELKGKENITTSGQKIEIFANIGEAADVKMVLESDAGGIGLFRSEFLYLQSDYYPTEEEQFAVYKLVLQKMRDKKVIIRTMDIGADKKIEYFNLPEEENPALGLRAIRISLTRVDIFKTQLRALYRASAYGKLSIMFPMIISVEEVTEIKEIIEEVKAALREEKILFNENVEIGIMIETPAAVMISDLLAKEVDFFSVGTNDLTSYTLAVDRQNQTLTKFDNPHHLAIKRMLKIVADNAHEAGIWIGVCGELAADTTMSEYFLSIGIDELSVSPPYVLPLREKIRTL